MSVNGQSAAGVTVPDTKLAREATELIRDRTSDLVYNHQLGSGPIAASRSRARLVSRGDGWPLATMTSSPDRETMKRLR